MVTQYQSFPGAPGDSLSIQKLVALRLPSLVGRSFLDVGCNEGFFCGYAKFDGAERVVGLDKSAVYLKRARERFPDCEFLQQSWDDLPQGPFDVILLASSIHYADDQALLIHNLMKELAQDGTLVLELGIHPKPGREWVKVRRSIDERLFPTLGQLEEVLTPYAWKRVSPSVAQPGDPLPRYVFHIRPRKPVAYLLMEPPAFGKSTISREVFQRAAIKVVSGDAIISRVADGTLTAPADLTAMVQQQYSPLRIDQVIINVAKAGLLNSLVRLFLQEASGQDFSLDAFIPRDFHAEVARLLSNDGYMPVKLTWDRVGEDPSSNDVLAGRAAAYLVSLQNQVNAVSAIDSAVNLPFKGTTGAVEHVAIDKGRLMVRGWALHESGEMPRVLQLSIGGRKIVIRKFEKQSRPDIQKHFGLSHAFWGYLMTTTLAPEPKPEDVLGIQVFGGNEGESLSGPFRKVGHLAGSC
jgi:SAM-dependent methyltransferase